jgi:hypothetical protein
MKGLWKIIGVGWVVGAGLLVFAVLAAKTMTEANPRFYLALLDLYSALMVLVIGAGATVIVGLVALTKWKKRRGELAKTIRF